MKYRVELAATAKADIREAARWLDEARSSRFFTLLGDLPIIVDDGTSGKAFGDIVHLARAHQLSAYVAAYLELAIRRGLPLATLDDKLKAAAEAVGVLLFAVP